MDKYNRQIRKKLNKEKYTVLLVGGGGREHAIAEALVTSPQLERLIVAPGNAGIAEIATVRDVSATDLQGISDLAREEDVDIVFVAPDDPLAAGLTDRLWDLAFPSFGPSQKAARIESSKHFAKELMARAKVPTAAYRRFISAEQARAALEDESYPLVIKADGLALGKGVYICQDRSEAETAIHELLEEEKFGAAGREILFEEYLTGPELTVLAVSDGRSYKLLPSARDHKRAYDGNQGPNTGGMGVIAPVPEYTAELEASIKERIITPILAELERQASPFKGILYCGLMLTADGPKVIEFNARFGDPEAQAVIPLLGCDFLGLVLAVIKEELEAFDLQIKEQASAVVVLASGGYPGAYEKGYPITGLCEEEEDIRIYHAGTAKSGSDFVTAGGRVLAITALAATVDEALEKAYRRVDSINFQGKHFRKDIGK